MMPYVLHAGLILAGCLIFYKVLLQKETFYKVNRLMLIACLLLSFSLPLIRVPQQWSLRKSTTSITPQSTDLSLYSAIAIPEDQHGASQTGTTAVVEQKTVMEKAMRWLVILYWFGVAAFGINFLIQIISLYYKAYSMPVIRDGRFRIVELAGDNAPCSFGNNIFINPAKYDWETYNQILLHEKIHIEQGHTLDIILAEIILVFQWFNPFAWLYRKELESNLEYLTDDQLLHNPEIEMASYQMSLLKVSAPHFPLSVTTNYNQSLLKKRLLMMNAKRSNMHTAWKYFFILPVLVLFVCLLNEPKVRAQEPTVSKNDNKNETIKTGQKREAGMSTEGSWFATIKENNVSIQFKSDEDDRSFNSTTFSLSELKSIPRDGTGTFSISRDAGTMEFTGRFEGNSGMGSYKFVSNKSYVEFLKQEGIDGNNEHDLMAYFMVDVKKSYVLMLKQQGYTGLGKNDLLPLAALKVDEAYIKSLKENGFSSLPHQDLISLKALGIDGSYIQEIKKAGFDNISSHQLVSFKAQGISGQYISDMRAAAKKDGKPDPIDKDSPDDIIAYKALNVDPAYIKSLEEVGLKDVARGDLVAMKAQGITADYIRNLKAAGYKDFSASDLIAIKAQNITPEFVKGFAPVGFTDISFQDAVPLKALGVTPEYVKEIRDVGFDKLSIDNVVAMKAQNITSSLIKEYKALGYPDLSVDDVIAAKATGTTPTFISSMKEKGHNLKSIQKYIQLKTAID